MASVSLFLRSLLDWNRPVAFERDTADPFGVDAFLESAKQGGGAGEKKRGLDTGEDERRKRARDD